EPAGQKETQDLDELEFDFHPGAKEPQESTALDDLELDLEFDLDGQEANRKEDRPDLDNFELDLDLETETTSQNQMTQRTEPHQKGIASSSLASASIQSPDDEETAEASEISRDNSKKNTGIRFLLLIILLLLLMAAGVFGAILYAQKNNISLPFIGSPTATARPEFQDPGNLRITPTGVSHSFLTHESAGRLLVIAGNIRNEYPQPRRHVQLRARLFAGEEAVATRMIYAGNTLPEIELTRMSIATIEKELNKQDGDRNLNQSIPSGKEIPFMFLFSDLPQGLSGFEIDVLRSLPASQQ
ncbi:DUF3426 domain-containing protein, partial [Desulfobotulus sp. H1]